MAGDDMIGASKRELYCVKEASAYSGLSLAELYRAARLGRIRHAREGRQLRFTPKDLEAYLRAHEEDAGRGGC